MAANDATPEVPKKVPAPTDASEAAKARDAQVAHDKLLRDSQGAKPLTATEKTTLADTEKLVNGVVKTFTDAGATPAQANRAANDFVNAKDDAGRAKVFTDSNVQQPQAVTAYEAKYGANTTDAIRSSVLLAQRVEKEQKATTVESTQTTDARTPAPTPTAGGTDGATILNNAKTAIDNSMKTFRAVQADGKPLPDSVKQVFQTAIDASAKITPAIIDTQRQALYQSVPGWTQTKEDKYLAVNNATAEAQHGFSPAVQENLAKLPETATAAQKIQAVNQMSGIDASAKKFSDAIKTEQAFYAANPAANNRDTINPQLALLANLSHGKAFASAVYAEALVKAGNAGDVPLAKAMMNEAAKDKNLTAVIPDIQKIYDGVMSIGGSAAPEAAADPLDKTIPGWAQTKAAAAAMNDQSLTPEQRMAKAAPLFETALNAAKTIKADDIDASKAKIGAAVSDLTGGRAKSLADLDKPENADLVKDIEADPTKKAQAVQLVNQDALLDRARKQNIIVSESYAQALSNTASDLQAQANREPANSSKLNAEANAMTDKAATVLKTLGQTDPNFGVAVDSAGDPAEARHTAMRNQKRIQEEIAQVNRGETIDPQKAAGATGARVAIDTINDSIMGHEYKFQTSLFGSQVDGSLNLSKAARPLEVGVNTTIEALDFAQEHVPVVGRAAGFAGDMMKGYLPSPDTVMPNAVEDLAKAKIAAPAAAKTVMDEKKESVLGNAVSLGSDLVSGQVGVISAKAAPELLAKAAPLIAKAMPEIEETAVKAALESGNWKIKLGAAATVGVAAAFGSRWAADELSHDILGTKRMSVGELASHSTAALAAAYTARGLSSAMPAVEGTLSKKLAQTALTSGATSTVFGLGEVNPFITNKATGQHYTAADTLINAGENLAFGATTGMAGRAVTPLMHFSTVGVAQGAGSLAKGVGKFVFNSQAGREAAESATGAAKDIAIKEVKPVFAELTTGFMGTSLGSAALRGGVGTGLGAATSFAVINPWETNSATGKNYTVGETLTAATEWGLGTGAGLAAARYPIAGLGIGYRAAVNALPGEGSTAARFMGTNLIATGERFVAGGTIGTAGNLMFGDKADASGKDYTWGQTLGNAFESGLVTGASLAAAPYAYSGLKFVAKPIVSPIGNGVNAGRRYLGTTAENAGTVLTNEASRIAGAGTLIGDNIVSPLSNVGAKASSITGDAAKQYGPGTRQYLLSHSLQVSTSLSSFYEYNKLNKLDKASDVRATEIKKEDAEDK
jgi:hypothetical protein